MDKQVTLPYLHIAKPGSGQAPSKTPRPEQLGNTYNPIPYPMVKLQLTGPSGKPIDEWGVIDTGADTTALPMRLLSDLGITPEMCRSDGLARTKQGLHPYLDFEPGIDAIVGGTWRIRLAGSFPPADWPFILLGQEDFFQHFVVTCDRRGRRVTLKAHDDVERVDGAGS